jgi:hypothetical protein
LYEPVSGQQQSLPGYVPHGKGKHAVEMFQAVISVLFIGMENDLGIAVRGKEVTSLPELTP